MTKWLAIVNPRSGGRRQSALPPIWWPRLKELVTAVEYTERPGHARLLAAGAVAYDGLAVVGGDGTIFEVLNGMDRSRQRLAVIPAGRGNCLGRDLNIRDAETGLSALKADNASPIDAMEIEVDFLGGTRGTYLGASTVALGYVASLVRRAERLAHLGSLAYVAAALLTLPRAFSMELSRDGEPHVSIPLTGLIVNNTAHLANARAVPDARLRDGLIDIVELSARWAPQTLHNFSTLSPVRFFDPSRASQGRQTHVRLAQPSVLMLDGELMDGALEVRVRCVPSAVQCLQAPAA